MLSTNTWTMSARQIIAPSIVVRGDEQQQAAHQLCEPGEDLVRR